MTCRQPNNLCAFICCRCRALKMYLGIGVRQVGYLGRFTSFPFLSLKLVNHLLKPMYQSDNASRLEEQEHDNQQAIDNSIEVTARQPTRIATNWQQREMIDHLWQAKDKSCPQE